MSEFTPANDNTPPPANDNPPPPSNEAVVDSGPPPEGERPVEAVAANDNVPSVSEADTRVDTPAEVGVDKGPPPAASDNVPVDTAANDNVAVDIAANDKAAEPEPGAEESPANQVSSGAAEDSPTTDVVDTAESDTHSAAPMESDSSANTPPSDPQVEAARLKDSPTQGGEEVPRWTAIDRVMATDILMTEGGLTRERAEAYVESFSGQIWVGTIPAGETLVRYSDAQSKTDPDQPFLQHEGRGLFGLPEGRFLGETHYADPANARFAYYLTNSENNASHVQDVTAQQPTLVLRGATTLGSDIQTLVLRPSDWSYGVPKPLVGRTGQGE